MKSIIIWFVLLCAMQVHAQNQEDMNNTLIKEAIESSKVVNREAVNVWNQLYAFGDTDKLVPELIERVEVTGKGVGAIRIIHLPDGQTIKEELTKANEEAMTFSFVIHSSPMPFTNYTGNHTIRKTGESKCEVTFSSIYEIDSDNKEEMAKVIKDFQMTFLSNL